MKKIYDSLPGHAIHVWLAVLLLVLMGGSAMAQSLSGSGTATDPYVINSLDDWNTFANDVNNGTNYSGKTVLLKTSIDGVTKPVGDANHRFKGTLDGDGKTITVNLQSSTDACTPFYALENATIRNLHIAGTVIATSGHGAGLASYTYGKTYIIHCRNTVSLTMKGHGTDKYDRANINGGYVAEVKGDHGSDSYKLIFEDCSFEGKLLAADADFPPFCGGYSGYNEGLPTFTNCLFAPAEIPDDTKLTWGYFYYYNYKVNINGAYVNFPTTYIPHGVYGSYTRVYSSVQDGSINKLLTFFDKTYYLPNAVSVSVGKTAYQYTGSDIAVDITLKDGSTELLRAPTTR